jgi:hypothetical protein
LSNACKVAVRLTLLLSDKPAVLSQSNGLYLFDVPIAGAVGRSWQDTSMYLYIIGLHSARLLSGLAEGEDVAGEYG